MVSFFYAYRLSLPGFIKHQLLDLQVFAPFHRGRYRSGYLDRQDLDYLEGFHHLNLLVLWERLDRRLNHRLEQRLEQLRQVEILRRERLNYCLIHWYRLKYLYL